MATLTELLPRIPTYPSAAAKNFLVAAAYFATAKLGLLMAAAHPNVTPVWPPSGIALAAVLLYGYRLLPGIALGALAANATTAVPLATAAGIAAGNTLEAFLGAFLLRHLVHFQPSLKSQKDILALFGWAALGSTLVAATVGALSLWAGGSLPWVEFKAAWLTWWGGDALGIMIVTPLVLVWAKRPRPIVSRLSFGEAQVVLCVLILINLIVFHGFLVGAESQYSTTYLSIATMVWAALRLGQREAVTATLIASSIAVWGTTQGMGPFADDPPGAQFLLLGGFLGVLSFMTLALSVVSTQHRRAREVLQASQERTRAIVDTARDAFVSVDANGCITDWNRRAEDIFGWSRLEAIGRRMAEMIVPARHVEAHEMGLKRFLDSREGRVLSKSMEVTARRRNGNEFPAELGIWITRAGSAYTCNAFVRDISERKEAESLLQRSEQRYRSLVTATASAVWHADAQGAITGESGLWQAFTGQTPDQYRGWGWLDAIHPDDREPTVEIWKRALRDKTVAKTECRLRHINGPFRQVAVRGVPVLDEAGQLREWIGTVTDINDRKHAEDAMRRRTAQFETLLNGAPLGVYLIDGDFRVRQVNPTALPVFGDIPDLIGRDFYEVMHILWPAARADEIVKQFRHTLETGQPHIVPELIEERVDRRVTEYYEWQINRIPLPDGRYGVVCYFRDISERVLAHRKIRESEERYRNLFNSIDEGFCVVEMIFDEHQKPVDYRFLEVNPIFEKQTGLHDVIGKRMRELRPNYEEYWFEIYGKVALSGETIRFANEAKELSRWFDVYALRVGEPQSRKVAIVFNDITERKWAEEAIRDSEAFNRSLMEGSADCLKVLDVDGKLVFINRPGMCLMEIDDFTPFIGRPWAALWPDGERAQPLAAVTEALAGTVGRFQGMCPTGKGTPKWWDVVVTPVRNAEGEIVRLLSVARDITASKQIEEHLSYLANYDALTGLPNRALFMDRLRQVLAGAARHKRLVAVLFLDLDGFKRINDTLGHDLGDQLLSAVAKRLVADVRASDTVARFGGDEFVLMLTDIARAADANRVARKILEVLSEPLELAGNELFVTTSIGISLYPRDGVDPFTLLKSADAAMYLAKKGGNRYRHHSPAISARASKRLVLERGLRRALARDEFVLHYQPEFELTSGRIDTVEVLMRWRRPGSDELVPPLEFIPLAEESGLIVPIGEWVLRAAIAQIQAWRAQGLATVRLAVNVSARQFLEKNMKKVIDNILKASGLDHSCLELELTESILQTDAAERILPALRRSGIKIAIDDFGTGFSSLSYLKRFPVHKLKIDRLFTRNIPAHTDNAAISTAIIAMAHSLGLEVTAEGVETREQLTFLRELRCDGAQGYLLSKPVSAEAMTALLAQEIMPSIDMRN